MEPAAASTGLRCAVAGRTGAGAGATYRRLGGLFCRLGRGLACVEEAGTYPGIGPTRRRRCHAHRSHGRMRARFQATYFNIRSNPFHGIGSSRYAHSSSASSNSVHHNALDPALRVALIEPAPRVPAEQGPFDPVEPFLRRGAPVAYHPFAHAKRGLECEVFVLLESAQPAGDGGAGAPTGSPLLPRRARDASGAPRHGPGVVVAPAHSRSL